MASKVLMNLGRSRNATVIASVRGLRQKFIPVVYHGVYKTDGQMVREGEMLVAMKNIDYHPGLNVSYARENRDRVLRAACAGQVFITTEHIQPDLTQPEMVELYGDASDRAGMPIKKLTFNVVAKKVEPRFRLVDTV